MSIVSYTECINVTNGKSSQRAFGTSGSTVSDRADCLHFVLQDLNHDISINLMVGREAGLDLIDETEVEVIRV